MPGTPMPSGGQAVRTVVDADHRPLGPDRVEQLPNVEPGPAADVEDALAARGAERVMDEPPPAQHVGRAVEALEPPDHRFVEVDLAHRSLAHQSGRHTRASGWTPSPSR